LFSLNLLSRKLGLFFFYLLSICYIRNTSVFYLLERLGQGDKPLLISSSAKCFFFLFFFLGRCFKMIIFNEEGRRGFIKLFNDHVINFTRKCQPLFSLRHSLCACRDTTTYSQDLVFLAFHPNHTRPYLLIL